MSQNKSDFQNFFALYVNIIDVEEKTSKESKPYVVGSGLAKLKAVDLPVRIHCSDPAVMKQLNAGETPVLIGRLGYEEWTGREDSVKHRNYVLHVEGVEWPEDDKGRNYVQLTLRAGMDGDAKFSAAGNMWTRLNASLGQGKDRNGAWRPSLWLTVKGFNELAEPLSLVLKGSLITVEGALDYYVKEDTGAQYLSVNARSFDYFGVEESAPTGEEPPEPE